MRHKRQHLWNDSNRRGKGGFVETLEQRRYLSVAFQNLHIFPTASQPSSEVVADVNGDGQPDILTVSGSDNTISVLLGNGNGTFQSPKTFAAGVDLSSLKVADINGDGKLDVVTANTG